MIHTREEKPEKDGKSKWLSESTYQKGVNFRITIPKGKE